MLDEKQRQLLTVRRDTLLNQLSVLDAHVQAGRLDEATAHQRMCERFGSDYVQQLESIQAELTRSDRHHKLRGVLVGLAVMIVPLLLLAHFGGITGLATIIIDKPITLDVNQTFTQNTTYIPDIPHNITSLRATGTYTGNGELRITHLGPNGTQQTIHHLEAINGTLLGNTTRNTSFEGTCEQTCNLNTTAGAIRIELTNGTLTLETLTYTVSETRNETQPAERAEEEATVPQPTPPPTDSLDNNTNTTPENSTKQSYFLGKNGSIIQLPENGTINITINETPQETPESTATPPPRERPATDWNPPGLNKLPEIKQHVLERAPQAVFSKGNSFAKIGTRDDANTTYPNGTRVDDDYWGRVYTKAYHDKAVQNMNRQVGTIYVLKDAADATGFPGRRYGNLIFTTKSFNETVTWVNENGNPFKLITIDEPLSAEITRVDTHIQAARTRLETGTGGKTGVCLVDSGVSPDQPYQAGIDFIDGDTTPQDENGHGTAMADAITTIAPEAQLYVARVLDQNSAGRASDAIQAIDWCMTQNVSVISMSFGGNSYDSWCDEASILAQKANEAAARGIFTTASAGNDGAGSMRSPACGSLVTSVANSDLNDTINPTTSLTNVTDLLAPGTDVQLRTLSGTTSVTGSSVSTAVTAGAGALLASTGVAPEEIQQRLRSTGVPVADNHSKQYPRVDTYTALHNQTNNLSLTQEGYQDRVEEEYGIEATACLSGCFNDGDPCGSCSGSYLKCTFSAKFCFGGTCGTAYPTYCAENERCTVSVNTPSCTTDTSLCTNGVDNDFDGATDGCDSDCSSYYQCASSGACCTDGCRYESAGTQTTGCTGQSCSDTGDLYGGGTCTETITACDGAGSCDPTYNVNTHNDYCDPAYYYGYGDDPWIGYYSCSGNSCVFNEGAGRLDSCSVTNGDCTATDWYCSGNQLSSTSTSVSASCSGDSCDIIVGQCSTSDGTRADTCTSTSNPVTANKVCNGGSEVDASSGTSCDGSVDYYSSSGACTYSRRYAECNGAGVCDTDSSNNYQGSTINVPNGYVADTQSGGSATPYSAVSCTNYCGTSGSAACSGENYVNNRQACGGTGTCTGTTTQCTAPATTSNGDLCSCDGQCTSGDCDDNTYQGGVEADRCKPSSSYCVTDASSPYYYASGSTVGDSTCYGGTSGSVWIADNGRFEIKNSAGTVLAIIDKYGSMGVRGAASWGQTTFESGYRIDNGAGTQELSIASADGDLRARGSLTQRTTPSGTGFHVNNPSGIVQAVISSTGNVLLKGDFASGLSLT